MFVLFYSLVPLYFSSQVLWVLIGFSCLGVLLTFCRSHLNLDVLQLLYSALSLDWQDKLIFKLIPFYYVTVLNVNKNSLFRCFIFFSIFLFCFIFFCCFLSLCSWTSNLLFFIFTKILTVKTWGTSGCSSFQQSFKA